MCVRVGGVVVYNAIRAESAQCDGTKMAYDITAMEVMTGHKTSTNHKHSNLLASTNEFLREGRGKA